MTRSLIITADDLGIDPRRDDGILLAYARGAITQASLMVRGPSAARAARDAMRIGLPIGLHLDLTETPACAPREAIPSLLDASGNKLGKHGLRAAVAQGIVERAHVEEETRAQLRAFRALTGVDATHVDGHQHVHTVPALAAWLAPVFREASVRTTRIPEQRAVHVDDPKSAAFYRSVAHDAATSRALYAAEGISSTEAFIGLDLMGFASSPAKLEEALLGIATGSIELMCHPGFIGSGIDDFNESPAREHELAVLLSLPFAQAVEAGRVRLVSFSVHP